jgi:predicted metal-dependent phosphoesterase TrpH
MKNVNLFNALKTIRTLAENNEEIISRLDAVEAGLKEVVSTIDTLATVKVLTEVKDNLDLLKKQENTRKSIIDYVVEHGGKVIIPIETWSEWEKILSGNIGDIKIDTCDCRVYTSTNQVEAEYKQIHRWGTLYIKSVH